MYKSKKDGKNHQANMTIEVRESDMKIVDSFYGIMNTSYGYVSHSFNQFIIVDDNANLVALDQGDAYPRSALLGKYKIKAGNENFLPERKGYTSFSLLDYKGDIGDNHTGATIGGLEYSDTCYLTAGSSIMQDENYKERKTQNIYVTATTKDSFSKKNTIFSWITNYEEGGSTSASTPILVKRNNNSFLLLWSQLDKKENSTSYILTNGKISYVFLDGEGKVISPIYTEEGYLSDCQPIINGDGSVVWYVLQNGNLSFYQVKEDGSLSVKLVTPTISSLENVEGGIEIKWESIPGAAKYRLYRNHMDENDKYNKLLPLADTQDANTSFTDTAISVGETYCYSVKALDSSCNEMHANRSYIIKNIRCFPVENVNEVEQSDSSSDINSAEDVSDSDEDEASDTKPKKKEPLKLSFVKIKSNGKKLTAIKGKVSVEGAAVKIQANNDKFKEAKVTGKKFYLKLVPKVGKYTMFTIKVTKPGYKSIKEYVMY